MWEKLKGKKTYIVAGAMIVYAVIVVGWQAGDWKSALDIIGQALLAAGIRNAI